MLSDVTTVNIGGVPYTKCPRCSRAISVCLLKTSELFPMWLPKTAQHKTRETCTWTWYMNWCMDLWQWLAWFAIRLERPTHLLLAMSWFLLSSDHLSSQACIYTTIAHDSCYICLFVIYVHSVFYFNTLLIVIVFVFVPISSSSIHVFVLLSCWRFHLTLKCYSLSLSTVHILTMDFHTISKLLGESPELNKASTLHSPTHSHRLHGDSSNSVLWTPHGLREDSPWTPYLIKTHYLININVKKSVLRTWIELATSWSH